MAELSPRTDTSTDGDTEDKAMGFHSSHSHGPVVSDASDKSRDQKTLRRLAQNREAARKSRLRKKKSYTAHTRNKYARAEEVSTIVTGNANLPPIFVPDRSYRKRVQNRTDRSRYTIRIALIDSFRIFRLSYSVHEIHVPNGSNC
ncbi:putative transcription factor bZIP family [Helianthus anomalus]